MCNAKRLSGPCQAGTARINEPWKRGAIDVNCSFMKNKSIAESSLDPKSGDRYV
ncbi:hypothetical protein [Fibrobacter succinogenes]|uniref:hypothetical protein n=1 Tax=Fibrobacter succinogenes TaxID=833 RepID=UPI0015699D55|nr:hypothetical protein [Fibrobacter succinogenes]